LVGPLKAVSPVLFVYGLIKSPLYFAKSASHE
jgi:hypothetical protein